MIGEGFLYVRWIFTFIYILGDALGYDNYYERRMETECDTHIHQRKRKMAAACLIKTHLIRSRSMRMIIGIMSPLLLT